MAVFNLGQTYLTAQNKQRENTKQNDKRGNLSGLNLDQAFLNFLYPTSGLGDITNKSLDHDDSHFLNSECFFQCLYFSL